MEEFLPTVCLVSYPIDSEGKQINVIRRKRDAECFNGIEFERTIEVKKCECTEEDWECDIGYKRKEDGPCYPISDI